MYMSMMFSDLDNLSPFLKLPKILTCNIIYQRDIQINKGIKIHYYKMEFH